MRLQALLEDPGDCSPVQVAHLRVGMGGLSDNTSLSFWPQESHADFSHGKERGRKKWLSSCVSATQVITAEVSNPIQVFFPLRKTAVCLIHRHRYDPGRVIHIFTLAHVKAKKKKTKTVSWKVFLCLPRNYLQIHAPGTPIVMNQVHQ